MTRFERIKELSIEELAALLSHFEWSGANDYMMDYDSEYYGKILKNIDMRDKHSIEIFSNWLKEEL